jgi:biopolymer transport protein ExbB
MKRLFPAPLAAAAVLAMIGFGVLELRAQTPEAAPPASPAPTAAPAATKPPANDKTFWQVVLQGGIMMIPMGLTSVTMIALVIDGFMRLRNEKLAPPQIVENMRSYFRAGDYNGAFQACRQHSSLFSNVVRTGLSMLGHGREACERAMEDALAKEVSTLGTRIRYLSVIGVVSPMLGLTGTVLGMISAFSTIGSAGIGDPSALAAAIGEVLVATATGLFIAIPAFAFYYVFSNRITAVTAFAEDVVSNLFRGMPYEEFRGLEVGDEPVYAAPPNPDLYARSAAPPAEPAPAEEAVEEEQEEQPEPVPQPVARAVPRPVAKAAPQVAVKAKRPSAPKVNCPNCQQPVVVGVPACPHCQTELNWGIPAR